MRTCPLRSNSTFDALNRRRAATDAVLGAGPVVPLQPRGPSEILGLNLGRESGRLLFGCGAVGAALEVRLGTTSGARLQPSYNTNPLQDLYTMAVDQRFDLPNNVLVLLTEENESRASNVALCVKFIDSIIEHDRALRTLQPAGDHAHLARQSLCRIAHPSERGCSRPEITTAIEAGCGAVSGEIRPLRSIKSRAGAPVAEVACLEAAVDRLLWQS